MRLPCFLRGRGLRSDAGYTIAESAVALALLLTVLVPAAATLTYLVTQRQTQHRMDALVIARHEMEQALAAVEGEAVLERADDETPPWRTVRDVEREGGLVLVTVSVYRSARPTPIVTLRTARLDPQSTSQRAGP